MQERFKIIYEMSLKGRLDIQYMCQIAHVSRSGYYAYVKRLKYPSSKELQDHFDFQMIKAAYEYKSWKKGAKQIRMRIERDYGIIMNLKKIRRLMKKYNLVCPLIKRNPIKAMIKAQQSHRIYKNIINRDFLQGKSKKVLLTDITYLTYANGKRAYLSVIKDASTRMILSWQLSLTLDLRFVINTVNEILDFYKGELDLNVIIHSDQGVHYTSIAYQELLKGNGITQSMSRRGNCWDNAPQESFFAILKTESELHKCTSYEKLVNTIIEYIKYYNYDRPQWSLNRMTPYEYDRYLTKRRHLLLPSTYIKSQIIYA